jgi:hypothetical protein
MVVPLWSPRRFAPYELTSRDCQDRGQLTLETGIELSRLLRIETGTLRSTHEEVVVLLEAIDTEESVRLAVTAPGL